MPLRRRLPTPIHAGLDACEAPAHEARPETAGAFAARVQGAEFAVVPGAAHGIFSDRRDETVALLRAWLQRHDPQ